MEGNNAETPRLRRPSWRDPRLIAGVLLVVLSVVGIVLLVRSLDRTEGYWAASADLVPGSALSSEHFTVVQAQLGDATDGYLRATEPAPVGAYVQGTVRRGELVPAESVVQADPEGRQPVSLALQDQLPQGIAPGDRVDVWIAAVEQNQDFAAPELVADGAELAEIREATGAFGTSSNVVVHVLLDPEQLPSVLEAKADGSRISVVPSVGGR